VPQVEVTFDIDANGIVNVSAKDKMTGKEQQIRIQASGGLSEAEIKRMVQESESHAAEDKKRRELVDARNEADALIYSAEKALKGNGDKVGEPERNAVEAAVVSLRDTVSGDDIGLIRQRHSTLAQAMNRFGEALQRAEAASPGAGAEASPSGAQDEVVDAEFEDVNDPKRKRG
jgi:molecular chaperone DnaK